MMKIHLLVFYLHILILKLKAKFNKNWQKRVVQIFKVKHKDYLAKSPANKFLHGKNKKMYLINIKL
jgi:hypothetical protein